MNSPPDSGAPPYAPTDRHAEHIHSRLDKRPAQEAERIVVQWVERHGCRESCDGPGMALRGVPLEQ